MRKLLSALFAVVLLATSAFANGRDGGRQGSMSLTETATGLNVKTGLPMNGLLSYKNAMENDVANPKNLDYSVGSATNTFTVSRDSTHPATYFDGNGVMQVTTTSDTARRTRGYYDATGWHTAPGWLLEGASTNYTLNSYFSIDTDANGTADNWSGGNGTRTLVDCSVNGLTSGKAQRSVHTYTGSESNSTQQLWSRTDTDTFNASGGNITTTLSFWAKGDVSGITTGLSTTHWVRVLEVDNTPTWQRNCLIRTLAQAPTDGLSSTEWHRFSFTFTVTDTDTRRLTVEFIGLQSSDKPGVGENAWIEVYGVQVEKQAYPSSFIPTTTAALTRNAETTNTYTTAGNFPAPSGGNCLSFDGANASGDDSIDIANSATGNQFYNAGDYSYEFWTFCRSDGEGDLGRLLNKNGTNYSCIAATASVSCSFDLSTTDAIDSQAWSLNTWNHVVAVFNNTSKTATMYVNGVGSAGSAGSGNLIDDSAIGLTIGNGASAGTRTYDGFIQVARIYRGKALSAAEVSTAYAAGRSASLPVSGCTAEYLFTEGTGTTLTDSVAGNNGTISGATWSKDTYSGSVMIKYRPIMLPSEQDANYKVLFYVGFAMANSICLINSTVAANKVPYFQIVSNSNYYYPATYSSASAWTRYQPHTLIITWSGSTAYTYCDGVLSTTITPFAIQAGVLPASFQIQSSAGQAMVLEELAVWDRVLPQSEVTQIQNRS